MTEPFDILVGESWVVMRDCYGEITWYLSAKELTDLEARLGEKEEA